MKTEKAKPAIQETESKTSSVPDVGSTRKPPQFATGGTRDMSERKSVIKQASNTGPVPALLGNTQPLSMIFPENMLLGTFISHTGRFPSNDQELKQHVDSCTWCAESLAVQAESQENAINDLPA